MAENKKSFILYCDLINSLNDLTREEKGELFETILDYVNDKNPVVTNRYVKIAFEPIKQQLKRDLRKFEAKKQLRVDAGKKGAEVRWQKIATDGNATNEMAKMPVNDNDNDNVNDTVNVNVISHEDKPKNMSELIAGWYNDLPNSSHIETICMNFKMTKPQVLLKIPEFKKAMDLTYPGYDKFINHFKNWLRKSSTVEGGQEYKPKKRNQI
jgi:hypothetical protein